MESMVVEYNSETRSAKEGERERERQVSHRQNRWPVKIAYYPTRLRNSNNQIPTPDTDRQQSSFDKMNELKK